MGQQLVPVGEAGDHIQVYTAVSSQLRGGFGQSCLSQFQRGVGFLQPPDPVTQSSDLSVQLGFLPQRRHAPLALPKLKLKLPLLLKPKLLLPLRAKHLQQSKPLTYAFPREVNG